MIYPELFLGFLKVGLFSFGGAYAAIPLIRDVVLEYGWLDEDMVTYMIAVSESTPGPIMVNMATYIGTSQGGVLGALIATFAVALPAFIIIVLVTALLAKVMKNRYVNATLDGIKASVIGIIVVTGAWLILSNVGAAPIVSWNGAGAEAGAIAGAIAGSGAFTVALPGGIDIIALIVTAILAALYIGVNRIMKKHKKKTISPILLIVIAAVMGAVAYGVNWSEII